MAEKGTQRGHWETSREGTSYGPSGGPSGGGTSNGPFGAFQGETGHGPGGDQTWKTGGHKAFKRGTWCGLAGGLAGVVNGFFGGGGGMVLVPLMSQKSGLTQREVFANSVLIILPLCTLSSVIYLFRGSLDMGTALPYLVGGLIGGFVGGKWFKHLNMTWLRRIFALFILYGGVSALL